MKIAEFHRICPNCGGIISDERLKKGLPCEKCLPKTTAYTERLQLCNLLGSNLKDFRKLCKLDEFTKAYTNFFKEKTGFSPWSLQITWAKRVALNKSFTMIAPTGVGKTTWGIVTSTFIEGKAYILVPTKLLVLQTVERLLSLTNKQIAFYTGKKSEKEKIKSGDYDILVTTTNFLYRNFEIIPKPFNFVFVDDVDSLLKSAKNIDKVLQLLGFTEEDINAATEIINIKTLLAKLGKKADEKLIHKLKKLEKLLEERKRAVKNILVVSSATSQPKSKRVKLFREILGFEVGKSAATLRNVEDILIYTDRDFLKETAKLIKKNGGGVFIFISSDYGKDYVDKVVDYLNENGINSVSYEEFTSENQEKFIRGEIQAAVGISSYRNPLARGIDIPQAVRYAIFIGVPKMEFSVKLTLTPVKLFGILLTLRNLIPESEQVKISQYLTYLKRYLSLREEDITKYSRLKERLTEIKEYIQSYFNNPEFMEKVRHSEEVTLKEKNGELYIVIGDAAGYIQASGRTSRMFAGGLTKGICFMFVDDIKALNSLKKRVLFFLEDISFKILNYDKGRELSEKTGFELIDEVSLKDTFKMVDRDRERIREILEGKVKLETKKLIKTILIVVESPNKARTIANFFGKPAKRKVNNVEAYEINLGNKLILLTASKGHVFDLTIRDGIWGVKEENNLYIPVYDTIKYCTKCNEQTTEPFCTRCKGKPDIDKITVIEALRELGLEIDEVFIASDPDTEGEKIGWDVGLSLKPYQMNLRRMEFHEVTKWAFLEALENTRDINENLVKAQIVRRVADRWVGFALSQKLWKTFKKQWLSAGRVQTPVLGWIIDRYKKSKEMIGILIVETPFGKFRFQTENLELFRKIVADKVKIKVNSYRLEDRNPPPPFNTGELLRESSKILKLSAETTMEIAQDLFESGFITYHRTDSTRVSTAGMKVAKEFISEKFGPDFVKLRAWGKGGAHECIRPTRPLDTTSLRTLIAVSGSSSKITRKHLMVYNLIFKRFIASQMIPAKVKEAEIEIKLLPGNLQLKETRTIEIIKDGWNLIIPIKTEPLPFQLQENEVYYTKVLSLIRKKVPKIPPYTQGELVEDMKNRKIGRPSTYAKIIQTLIDRHYVIEKKNFLFPTKLGIEIFNYLSVNFENFISEEFTRKLEEEMEKVENGEINYQYLIGSLKSIINL